MNSKRIIILSFLAFFPSLVYSQSWKPKQVPLETRFAKEVNPHHVLPEYPRPQMVREKWLNLNGLWRFHVGTKENKSIPKGRWKKFILVPFPEESALSGIKEKHPCIWYHRTFTIPRGWENKNVLLHFGAVDFESDIFINGKKIGTHEGGYDPFSFDISSALKSHGKQKITIRVFDPTDNGGFPRGKQSLHPGGIMYTSTTGIWQTVWLEPVPKTYINHIRIIPNIDQAVVKLRVNPDGNLNGFSVVAKVKKGSKVVQEKYGKPNTELTIPVPNEKLWSPGNPFLYGLEVSLVKNDTIIDHITSYFGMRKISVKKINGYNRILLNNKFLFELGPLDQGFWPAGVYTAPTDGAIKNDLMMVKKFGFNMIRKHIKVEPQRWYYWADKLGLLVWQDMPSADSYTPHAPPVDTAEFASELMRMVQTHWNHPCIVTWTLFNEAQGQHDTKELVNKVEALDPSRLVNQSSGSRHYGVGDIDDRHSYPAPVISGRPFTKSLVIGEYGGIAYNVKGHLWEKTWGHGEININSRKALNKLYDKYANLLIYDKAKGLNAAVYTQLTDVESETNGLMTYDRAVVKIPVKKIRAINERVINEKFKVITENLYLTKILSSSQKKGRPWKYTFKQPDTGKWYKANFDDSGWRTGLAGFGKEGNRHAMVRSVWDTKNIWIRHKFTLGNLPSFNHDNQLVLYIYHDDDCEVYINGVKAAAPKSFTSGYKVIPVYNTARNALIPNRTNVIAIHCVQKGGGQYIDAGIYVGHLVSVELVPSESE